jgi:hypothetical protein
MAEVMKNNTAVHHVNSEHKRLQERSWPDSTNVTYAEAYLVSTVYLASEHHVAIFQQVKLASKAKKTSRKSMKTKTIDDED